MKQVRYIAFVVALAILLTLCLSGCSVENGTYFLDEERFIAMKAGGGGYFESYETALEQMATITLTNGTIIRAGYQNDNVMYGVYSKNGEIVTAIWNN